MYVCMYVCIYLSIYLSIYLCVMYVMYVKSMYVYYMYVCNFVYRSICYTSTTCFSSYVGDGGRGIGEVAGVSDFECS